MRGRGNRSALDGSGPTCDARRVSAPLRLFVYSSLLSGEAEHELLQGAPLLGLVTTLPEYHLFELGPFFRG